MNILHIALSSLRSPEFLDRIPSIRSLGSSVYIVHSSQHRKFCKEGEEEEDNKVQGVFSFPLRIPAEAVATQLNGGAWG